MRHRVHSWGLAGFLLVCTAVTSGCGQSQSAAMEILCTEPPGAPEPHDYETATAYKRALLEWARPQITNGDVLNRTVQACESADPATCGGFILEQAVNAGLEMDEEQMVRCASGRRLYGN